MPRPEDFTPAVRDQIHAAMLAQDAAKRTRDHINAFKDGNLPQMPRACAETGLKPRAASPAPNRAPAQNPVKNRLPRGESPLEVKFARLWGALAPDIALVREYAFHPERRFRLDFCHKQTRVAVECEGVTKQGGRHQRIVGYQQDCRKYFEAQIAGFVVFRLTRDMICSPNLERIADFIREKRLASQAACV